MSDKKVRIINDKAQTAIFLCFLIIFPVFALAFNFYSQTNLGFSEVLDKSFSVLIGVFGGAATLTAAYIATLLFNDWRVQEKTIFTRNVACETSELILTLFNIMQGYTEEKEGLLNQIMPIQSKIMLKLSILNKHIKDNQMHLVNDNFRGFMFDYIEAINLYQHDRQALKGQVSILIKSYGGELSYLTELANLDNVFEKLKTVRT